MGIVLKSLPQASYLW